MFDSLENVISNMALDLIIHMFVPAIVCVIIGLLLKRLGTPDKLSEVISIVLFLIVLTYTLPAMVG